MQAFIQGLIIWYFGILHQYSLVGVVVLMAMESSIFPVPSELVIPPAAVVYMDDIHRDGAFLLLFLVILAGTVGSFIGASVTYWVARWLGRPLVVKYGKYVLISERKLHKADQWMIHYGAGGIFIARLLPVVRHIISIPAGIVGMRFRTFAWMTLLGSFIWCTVLTVFGVIMAKDMQAMIAQPGSLPLTGENPAFKQAFHNLTIGTLALVGVVTIIYWLLLRRQQRMAVQFAKEQAPSNI